MQNPCITSLNIPIASDDITFPPTTGIRIEQITVNLIKPNHENQLQNPRKYEIR